MNSQTDSATVEADAGRLTFSRNADARGVDGDAVAHRRRVARGAVDAAPLELKHLWYRARLPIRRRRWTRDNIERTQAFAKYPAARPTVGPAIAFGEFSGAYGLGRAAAYDLPAVDFH